MMKIRLFLAKIEDISESPETVMERMPEPRRVRFTDFRLPAQRLEYAASSLALERAAACLAPGKLGSFRYDEWGRPCMDGLCVSLSHSAGLAVCAAGELPVGVDIERRDRPLSEGMLRRFGSLDGFIALEACVKLTGEGLGAGMNRYRLDGDVMRDMSGRRVAGAWLSDIGAHRVCVCCAGDFCVEIN